MAVKTPNAIQKQWSYENFLVICNARSAAAVASFRPEAAHTDERKKLHRRVRCQVQREILEFDWLLVIDSLSAFSFENGCLEASKLRKQKCYSFDLKDVRVQR